MRVRPGGHDAGRCRFASGAAEMKRFQELQKNRFGGGDGGRVTAQFDKPRVAVARNRRHHGPRRSAGEVVKLALDGVHRHRLRDHIARFDRSQGQFAPPTVHVVQFRADRAGERSDGNLRPASVIPVDGKTAETDAAGRFFLPASRQGPADPGGIDGNIGRVRGRLGLGGLERRMLLWDGIDLDGISRQAVQVCCQEARPRKSGGWKGSFHFLWPAQYHARIQAKAIFWHKRNTF